MSDTEKKYYWLKLKRDFFKRHDVRIIEEMENGKDYLLFYLKLLVESVDHNGALRFSDTIPYNERMLSVVTNTNVDIVKDAMEKLTELGLMEKSDDGTIYVKQIPDKLRDRSTTAYKHWRKSVFERDQYTCRRCKAKGIRLNAHHIKSWKLYPELRFDTSNGITLCERCHKLYHKKYGR